MTISANKKEENKTSAVYKRRDEMSSVNTMTTTSNRHVTYGVTYGIILATSLLSLAAIALFFNTEKTKARAPNKKLRPLENPGGGDCLFWCFKQALESVGQNVSVAGLRRVVSDHVDEETFVLLRSMYHNAVEEKNLEVQKEFSYLSKSDSLQALKQAMLTSEYWGDEFAVIALEKFTGLQAFILKDGKFQKRPGVVQREKMIFLDLRNEHYRLFTSDTGAVFRNPNFRA